MCACTSTTTTWLDEARGWSRAVLVVGAVTLLADAAASRFPPTYIQDALEAEYERHGWRWHPDDLMGGFCEPGEPSTCVDERGGPRAKRPCPRFRRASGT